MRLRDAHRIKTSLTNKGKSERDNVVYWKETKKKINDDLQCN